MNESDEIKSINWSAMLNSIISWLIGITVAIAVMQAYMIQEMNEQLRMLRFHAEQRQLLQEGGTMGEHGFVIPPDPYRRSVAERQ